MDGHLDIERVAMILREGDKEGRRRVGAGEVRLQPRCGRQPDRHRQGERAGGVNYRVCAHAAVRAPERGDSGQ